MRISSDYSLVPYQPRVPAAAPVRPVPGGVPEAIAEPPLPRNRRRSDRGPGEMHPHPLRAYPRFITRQSSRPGLGARVDVFA
jgi:hypothetical protein